MPRTLGVEEEFNLVDVKTRRLTARAPELLAELSDTYVEELQRCVIEVNSGVFTTLDCAAICRSIAQVLPGRRGKLGIGVVAAGAMPLAVPTELQVTETARVPPDARRLSAAGPRTADLRHSGARRIADRDEAVHRREPSRRTFRRCSRSRRVHPFWSDGADTGYASVPHPGLAALADDRAVPARGVGRRIRPADRATWSTPGSSPTPAWSISMSARRRGTDPRTAGVRQLPLGRHDRPDRRAVPGAGANVRSPRSPRVNPASASRRRCTGPRSGRPRDPAWRPT